MNKDDYLSDLKKWLEKAPEKQVRLIWIFAKSCLKK